MKKIEYKKMFNFEDKHFWFVGKKLFVKTFLDKYLIKKQLKILDLGCGTGGLTNFLSNYGEVVGIEKNKYAVDLARKRYLYIKIGDVQKLPFSLNNFDLVTIFDVLYHHDVKIVDEVIVEARRVLKPSGYLLITDSAFSFLKSKHDLVLHGDKRFNINQLTNILKENDFVVLKSSYIFFCIFPLVLIKRKFTSFLERKNNSDIEVVPKLINYLLIKLLAFEAWLLNYINFPLGSSLIILAKKRKNVGLKKQSSAL